MPSSMVGERVRAYHGVWPTQLEQGQAIWEQEEKKIRYWCALVWHPATSASTVPSTSVASSTRKQPNMGFTYNAPTRPGNKVCKTLNEGSCTNAAAHPSQLHICSHYLTMVGRTLPHWVIDWNRMQLPPESLTIGYAALKDISLDNSDHDPDHPWILVFILMISSSTLVAPASGVRGCRWGPHLWLPYALIQTPWLPGLGPQVAAGKIPASLQ